MDSIACISIIFSQIQKNAFLFENKDLKILTSGVFKLGYYSVQNPLPCSVLTNVLKTLKELHKACIVTDDDYYRFLTEVNKFYKQQSNICPNYKSVFFSCFSPAVEIELTLLLQLCSNISNADELINIKSTVENSILVHSCQVNYRILQKVSRILKRAFLLSEGNPVLGCLIFCFFKSVREQPFCQQPQVPSYIETYFSIPLALLSDENQEYFIKNLVQSLFEAINLKLCSKNDVLFKTAVFPMYYFKMLDSCFKQTFIFDFLTFLSNDSNFEICDRMKDITSAKKNCIWNYVC